MRYKQGVFLIFAMLCASASAQVETPPPREVRDVIGYAPLIWSDGAIEHLYTAGEYGQQVTMSIRSEDGGKTWSDPQPVMKLPAEGKWASRSPQPMIDREGNLHLFLLDVKPAGMATWHAKRLPDGSWTPLQQVCVSGPQTAPIQLRTGRIMVCVGYNLSGAAWDSPIGRAEITTFSSDDGGATWHRSPDKLAVPLPSDVPGRRRSGSEPVAIELPDGRVWMLIRVQNGWLYESYSDDGVHWSMPLPTEFRSSDSPAALARLSTGELIIVWNNCDHPAPVDGRWMYTGRDALHAAISADNGKSWRGYREVYLDPFRDADPPETGDRGTAYPHAAAAPDGTFYLIAGQAKGRYKLFHIDPAWLRATSHADDFSEGLKHWSVFKTYGPIDGGRRARVAGAQLVAHPTIDDARALHIRRPDEKDGDGAAWNFPAGKVGKVTLRILLRRGFHGGLITLTDRFIYPQMVDLSKVAFALALPPDGRVGTELLAPDRWYTMELSWKTEHRSAPAAGGWPGECVVSVDGRDVATLPQLNRAKAGLSYLRLHSTAAAPDPGGMLIDRVAASVQPPNNSARDHARRPGDGARRRAGHRHELD